MFCKGNLTEKGTLPSDVPRTPKCVYSGQGWKGMGDWLGTGTIATFRRKHLSFEEARAFVHSLKLKGYHEWRMFKKGLLIEKGTLPADIPRNPNTTYASDGWKGYGDWVGTGRIASFNKSYRPFKKARIFVHSLKLKSVDEWITFCRGQFPEKGIRPADIPRNPSIIYATKGWLGYGDWLGTGRIANFNKSFRPFKEARNFIHSLKLKSVDEWKRFCGGQFPEKGTRPADIPRNPNITYAGKGWLDYGDWLGTGAIAPNLRVYRPFEVSEGSA